MHYLSPRKQNNEETGRTCGICSKLTLQPLQTLNKIHTFSHEKIWHKSSHKYDTNADIKALG